MSRHRLAPGRSTTGLLVICAFLLLGVLILGGSSALGANRVSTSDSFRFVYPAEQAARVEPLQAQAESELRRLADRFDMDVSRLGEPPIEVLIAADAEDFRRAQPARQWFDTWMAGTAYPSRGLIILSLQPELYFSLEETLDHEISHVALYRASGNKRSPRWLDEGLAIHHARQDISARARAAAGATLREQLVPFEQLERGFPSAVGQVRLAYAQSALFVRWLVARHDLERVLPIALAESRATDRSLTDAIEAQIGPLGPLGVQWRDEFGASASWLTVLSDGALWWSLAALVFFAALIAVRQRQARRIVAADPGPPTDLDSLAPLPHRPPSWDDLD